MKESSGSLAFGVADDHKECREIFAGLPFHFTIHCPVEVSESRIEAWCNPRGQGHTTRLTPPRMKDGIEYEHEDRKG